MEANMNEKPKGKNASPDYAAYNVVKLGERTIWNRIGSAWNHGDGEGFTLRLSAAPVDGQVVIRKPLPKRSVA